MPDFELKLTIPGYKPFTATGTLEAIVVTPPAPNPPAPPPAPNPPAPPPPPVPGPGGGVLLKVSGNTGQPNNQSAQYTTRAMSGVDSVGPSLGPFDYLDTGKLMPSIPWRGDPAPSMQGLEPKHPPGIPLYNKYNVYGTTGGLYYFTPVLVRKDGQFAIESIYPQFGEKPFEGILDGLKKYPQRPGKRNMAVCHPYVTWHGHDHRDHAGTIIHHPDIPAWIGVAMDGWVWYGMYDGELKRPYRVVHCDGTANYVNDFCYLNEDRSKFYYVVCTPSSGKVVEVHRPITSDPSTWTERVLADGFGVLKSLRASGGKLYITENSDPGQRNTGAAGEKPTGGRIIEIDPGTGVQRTLPVVGDGFFTRPFWIDTFSNGDLCVVLTSGRIYRISPVTGVASTYFASLPGGHQWITCSVDRFGTCGERDTVNVIYMHAGAGNTEFHRIRPGKQHTTTFSASQSKRVNGYLLSVYEATGHYPWVGEVHPIYAWILVQGASNPNPGVIAVHATAPRVEYPMSHDIYSRGDSVFINGGEAADYTIYGPKLWGTTPSFSALANVRDGSMFGLEDVGTFSMEHIAEMPVAKAVAFIQSGMVGTTPRNITRQNMRALLFTAWINSQLYLEQGKPFIDRQFAAFDSLPAW